VALRRRLQVQLQTAVEAPHGQSTPAAAKVEKKQREQPVLLITSQYARRAMPAIKREAVFAE